MPTATWTTRQSGHQLILEPADKVGQMICSAYSRDEDADVNAVQQGIRMITGPDVPLEPARVLDWTGHTAHWTRAGTTVQGWWLMRGEALLFITWMRPSDRADAHAREIPGLLERVLTMPRPEQSLS